ncbi:Putative defensin-like protein 184 [Linum grandiflorum]
MAKSFVVYFYLVLIFCVSLEEMKMTTEATDCHTSWDCAEGQDRCQAKCSWRYNGTGICPDHPPNQANLCICEYECS